MLKLPSKVYISSSVVDMRKSIDGLAAIVERDFNLDPYSDSLFIWCNKACDKLKLLYWDTNGFCLIYKRLERGKFDFKRNSESSTYSISKSDLTWLLTGLDHGQIEQYHEFKRRKIV